MRHPDCYARLNNLWLSKSGTPFSWGEHDCLTLALDAVEAVTGDPLFHPRRPHRSLPYDSYRSARKLLEKRSLLARAERALKKFSVVENAASLQSGDIALVSMSAEARQAKTFLPPPEDNDSNWLAFAVVDLCPSGFVLPRLPQGITRVDRRKLSILKAWHLA